MKFWYRDGEFIEINGEHTEAHYLLDSFEESIAHDPLSIEYEDFFEEGWIRIYVDSRELDLHSPQLVNMNKVKYLVNEIIEKFSNHYFTENAKVYVDTSVDGRDFISFPLRLFLKPIFEHEEEYWEHGPADQWISRIHKDLGVARLKRRRTLRAQKLSILLS